MTLEPHLSALFSPLPPPVVKFKIWPWNHTPRCNLGDVSDINLLAAREIILKMFIFWLRRGHDSPRWILTNVLVVCRCLKVIEIIFDRWGRKISPFMNLQSNFHQYLTRDWNYNGILQSLSCMTQKYIDGIWSAVVVVLVVVFSVYLP